MFKRKTKLAALLVAATMLVGSLSGCADKSDQQSKDASASTASTTQTEGANKDSAKTEGETTLEPVTLKVLMTGDKPNDWDKVLEEFYTRTKDILNITFEWTWVPSADYKDKLNVKMTAGEEYDLVFDAPWMHLRTLALDGAYADLSPYLNNDAYPGLKKAFPEEIMKYNKYAGINCALPLLFAYGNVDLVMYRMDWAREFGIGTEGQINSRDELQAYLDAVLEKKQGVTPIALKDNRGFYRLFDAVNANNAPEIVGQNIYMGSLGQDIFFAFKLNEAGTEVVATALPGDSAEYWEAFGGVDFWKQKVENQREWNKYTETDSLNQKDPGSLFQIGKAAACIDGIDAVPKFNRLLKGNVPEAELGIFVHDKAAREMEKGAYGAIVTSNNCLAIPSTSKNIDRTMSFLNWLFESAENHDLFEYGIEGVHWEAIGDNQYKAPDGVDATTNYITNGWNLTWTPQYYRYSADYTEAALPYAEFASELDNYTISPITGFTFNSDAVKTEITQCGAILGEILTPVNHGILENPYELFQKTTVELRKNNVQVAIDEYVRQLNEFLQSK